MTDVPEDLGPDGVALWERMTNALDEGLQFDALELDRLHRACVLEDMAAAMCADIETRGLWTDTPKGQVPNPMILRLESMQKTIANLLAKMSLSLPTPTTGHLSRAQRNRLRDMRARGAM